MGLTREQIAYLKEFIAELQEKILLEGDEYNENFLDDVVNKGRGTYRFRVDEGQKYQRLSGEIYVSGLRVSISIGYESLFLSRKRYSKDLAEIAERTGVHVYQTTGNHVEGQEPNGLGFVNIQLFREDGHKLTLEEFIKTYLFKVSRAANAAKITEERY